MISISNKRTEPGYRPQTRPHSCSFAVTMQPINREFAASSLFGKVYRPVTDLKASEEKGRHLLLQLKKQN